MGDTTAPSTNATGHDSPTTSWPTTATVSIVAITSPMASMPIGRALDRSSRRFAKKAAA